MIRVLEDRVINKIAAGEVIERPASIVKELVENAIDAGSTVIRVELKAGGRNLVRVTDNGKGMDRHDSTLCLERHATSKIRSDEDLFSVTTLGFRGEALPSIAAVGRFELRSRRKGDEIGNRIAVEGGRLVDISDIGCPEGTDISLRSVFFNIPARRKFLRTAGTELSHCLEAVTRQVLCRPDIDIEVVHDGRTVLRSPTCETKGERAGDLLGPHGQALVPIEMEKGNLNIEALVSPVGVHRSSSRGSTYMYVNGRFVNDMVMRRALREAYRGLVPKGRHPTVVIAVTIPPDHVDVNVHPAKTEVRFQFPYELTEALGQCLREGLEEHGIKKPVATESRYQPRIEATTNQSSLPLQRSKGPLWGEVKTHIVEDKPSDEQRRPEVSHDERPISQPAVRNDTFEHNRPRTLHLPTDEGEIHHADNRDLLPVDHFGDLRVLGQLAHTYVLCEGGGELVVVDQHAAHERIMLHQLMKSPRRHLGSSQRFLTPPIIELSPARATALKEHVDALAHYGFEWEPFGGNSFAVKQVPEALGRVNLHQLLPDVADDIIEGGKGKPVEDIVEHVLATMACHSAIRAGQTMSPYEMRELLSALDRVDFSVCAHGRPVTIRISQTELERRFHRT